MSATNATLFIYWGKAISQTTHRFCAKRFFILSQTIFRSQPNEITPSAHTCPPSGNLTNIDVERHLPVPETQKKVALVLPRTTSIS